MDIDTYNSRFRGLPKVGRLDSVDYQRYCFLQRSSSNLSRKKKKTTNTEKGLGCT